MLGEPAINRMHPDYDAMQVMNQILGGSNGRLFRELRESQGLHLRGLQLYKARFGIAATGGRRWMCARTSPRPRCGTCSPNSTKMRDQLVPDDEFKDAQRSLTASFALSLENPAELLNLYIVRQLYNFPVDYWDRYTDRIMAVTPAQVQAVARKYLDRQAAPNRRRRGCGQDCSRFTVLRAGRSF